MAQISVTEAHNRFGDLARIRNGVTHWIDVVTPDGRWVPVFDPTHGFILTGYEFISGAR